ncbi:MAG: hypothetical protein V1861_07090 [Candidatus Micrarchaeota archaeon]
MRIPNLLLLLTFSILLITALPFILHAADPAECATCEELINAPQTGIFVLVNDIDSSNRYLNIVAYYENLSASPSRQPLNKTILLVELTSPTGNYVLQKTFTNENGTAKFSYTAYDSECLNFKVLYCPFCVPPEVECEGFMQCVDFGHLDTSATNADGVTTATDAVVIAPAELNTVKYLPSLGTASWCPPPPPLAATPALCFPLILIFSLLSGALYLTGRNPFAGFNIGGMRTGQHIRYQARGRGFSFSFTQLAMAGMSVGEAISTASKQGGGALVKREKDAAKARGIGGIWTHDAGKGKSGSFMAIDRGLSDYKRGRDTVRYSTTAQAAGGKGSTGTGIGTSSRTGGASMGQTATGQQTSLTSGQGVSGREILGGNAFNMSSIARIALFVVMNTTIGGAIGACYSAATWNAQAGSGRNMFSDCFSSSQQRIVDASATLTALTGPNGGMMISVDTGGREPRLVEVLGTPTTVREGDPPRTLTAYTIAAPAGSERGQTADGRITIVMDSNGQVARLQMQVILPRVDAQGVPVLDKNGQQIMEAQTIRMLPPAEPGGNFVYQRGATDPTDPSRMTFSALPSTTPAAIESNFRDMAMSAGYAAPIAIMPGQNPGDFQQSYQIHAEGMSALQQTIRTEAAFEMQSRADAVSSGLRGNPEARDAIAQARYDAATEAMANLGIPVTAVRYGGTGEIMSGVQHGDSDLPGHTRGASETVLSTLHDADEGAGRRTIGVPSLTSLANEGGVTNLAMAAGMDLDRAGVVAQVVAPVLAHMRVDEIATTNQTNLADRIMATNADRAAQIPPLPPISRDDAMAFAAVATGARSIASEFIGTLRGTEGFTGHADTSGRTLLDRVSGTDLSALAVASHTGHMMQPDGIGALLVSRPDVVSGYQIPDAIAQPAREMAALDTVSRVASQPPGSQTTQAVNNAIFDYATAAMVNTARGTEGALQDSEYGQATRGLDSGAHHAAVAQTFGELPARTPPTPPPPGVPAEAWAEGQRVAERQQPTSIESVELNRREHISSLVSQGDYSTARAEIADAVSDYNTAARAARALGNRDAALTMEAAATAYSAALPHIDVYETSALVLPESQRPSIANPSPHVGALVTADVAAAGNPAELAMGVAEVRAGHFVRRSEDMIGVKEHIEQRLPADKRPTELYAEGRATPLTPTVPGLRQGDDAS